MKRQAIRLHELTSDNRKNRVFPQYTWCLFSINPNDWSQTVRGVYRTWNKVLKYETPNV